VTAAVLPQSYELVEVRAIKPHPLNANVGDVEAIAESINAIGFYGALIVHRSTGHILAGEHRWRAARLGGLGELPAIVVECDDDTAERILVGDNAYARLARWDEGALVELLQRRQLAPLQLAATGITAEALGAMIRRAHPEAPSSFAGYGDDIETEHTCPACGYRWSGKPS
jgi:ParB-like chromosome segregation protein Spo0J